MIIRYELVVEDYVTFSLYHYHHSLAMRRSRAVVIWGLPLSGFLCAWFVAWAMDDLFLLVYGGVVAVLWVLVYPGLLRRCVATSTRSLYSAGSNEKFIGPHEMEITAAGLTVRDDFSEATVWWHGIEKVISDEGYTFVYINSFMAYVIPQEAITDGDYEEFVETIKERLLRSDQA